MQSPPTTTRHRRRRGFGPGGRAWPALVLAIGLLSQAWLAAVHGRSHAAAERVAAVAVVDHGDCGPGRPHGHDERGPARPDEGCRLCAAIAVGKLGWASPGPAVVAEASEAPGGEGVAAAERAVGRGLTRAAPRGPPVAA